VNEIHPTAIIEGDVHLGDGNTIGPFAVITGPVTIGDDNWFGAGVVIGAAPEVRSFHQRGPDQGGVPAGVLIGSHNVLREYAQIHQGMAATTRVGDGSFIMNQAYIAHDSRIGNEVTLASSVLLAGHVVVEDRANIGMGTCVHQFRHVGVGAMVGMGAVVTRDIPAYSIAYGSPARVRGANRVGLERAGCSPSVIADLDGAYSRGLPIDASALPLPLRILNDLTAASLRERSLVGEGD